MQVRDSLEQWITSWTAQTLRKKIPKIENFTKYYQTIQLDQTIVDATKVRGLELRPSATKVKGLGVYIRAHPENLK